MKKIPRWLPGLGLALAGLLTRDAVAQEPPATPEPPEATSQTVVTGTRTEQRAADATVPTEVITRREIEASGARDLAELLETHPGVEVIRSPFQGSGIRLQGLDPAYVLLLVDGERVAGRVAGTLDLTRFSLSDLERVEIVKGPASVLYGSDAMGGVVNLITRRLMKPLQGEARAEYGTLEQLDLRGAAGAMRGPFALDLGGTLRRGDAFRLDPTSAATSGSAYNTWSLDGDLDFAPSDNLGLSLKSDYTRRDTHGVDVAPSNAVFDRRNRTEFFDTSFLTRWTPDADTRLVARLHYSLFRDQLLLDQRGSRALDDYQDVRERLGEGGLEVDHRFAGRHLASAGIEGLRESLSSPRLASGAGLRYRLGLFAQDDWQVLAAPRLALTAGIRLDLDSQFGSSPSPRIAARLDPLQNLTLRASYGWGFRSPSFQEQLIRFENPGVGYVVEGNPALRPELSQGLSLSADFRPGESVLLSLSLYRTDLRNLITVVTLQNPDPLIHLGYANVASARTQGGEVTARLKLVKGVWLDLGYALTDARNRDTGELLEGRAVHTGTAQLTARYRPWGLEGMARAAVVGARPFSMQVTGASTGGAILWAPPYANVDLRVSKQVFEFLSVYATATNLLNAADPQFLLLPPRGFHAGLIARY